MIIHLHYLNGLKHLYNDQQHFLDGLFTLKKEKIKSSLIKLHVVVKRLSTVLRNVQYSVRCTWNIMIYLFEIFILCIRNLYEYNFRFWHCTYTNNCFAFVSQV